MRGWSTCWESFEVSNMNEQSRIQSISLELYNKGYLTGIVEGENS